MPIEALICMAGRRALSWWAECAGASSTAEETETISRFSSTARVFRGCLRICKPLNSSCACLAAAFLPPNKVVLTRTGKALRRRGRLPFLVAGAVPAAAWNRPGHCSRVRASVNGLKLNSHVPLLSPLDFIAFEVADRRAIHRDRCLFLKYRSASLERQKVCVTVGCL